MTDRAYDPFKDGFTVEPGRDGTFIVYGLTSNNPQLYTGPRWGFSSAADLMRWLQKYEKPEQPWHPIDGEVERLKKQETTKERLLRERAEREKANGSTKAIALPGPALATPAKDQQRKRRTFGPFRL